MRSQPASNAGNNISNEIKHNINREITECSTCSA